MPSTRTAHRFALRLVPVAVVLLGVPLFTGAAAAESAVPLGTAESFAVLAGSAITNTGSTTITGDIGSYPTDTQTGVDDVTLIGTNHGGSDVTRVAKDDLLTAYNDAFGRTGTSTDVELGGKRLFPGVYSSETFGLTGILTLDSGGDPNASFVFQAGFTLITEVDSSIVLVGVDPCRVVWQVGSSATFKVGTDFVGDVLAAQSITAQTNATFQGRLLASNGAVTLDTNTITSGNCLAAVPDTTTTTAPDSTTTTTAPGATTTVPDSTTTTTAPESTTTTTAPESTTTTTAPSPTTTVVAPSPTTTSTMPVRATPTTLTPAATPAFAPSGPLAAVPAVPALAVPGSPDAGTPNNLTGTPSGTPSGTPTGTATSPPSRSAGPPARPSLPATGTSAVGVVWTALGLVAVGGMVVTSARRTRA